MVIIDSGAAVSVVLSQISHYLNNIVPSTSYVAIAADGNSLSLSGQGDLGPLSNVLISDDIQHNCISVSRLCDLGYEVKFSKERMELCLGCDSVFGPREGGLYLFPLVNLVSLSSPFPTVLNIGSQTPDIDVLDLWHRRLADTSHRVIRETVRNRLIEGIVLDRKYFNLKSRKQYRCSCDICARAKMHRVLFPAVRDRLVGLLPGSYVSADVLIMQNIPSREGYCYVLFLIDHASKMSFVFL